MKKTAAVLVSVLMSFAPVSVGAISESKKEAISKNCSTIVENLKELQHEDSKTRVYLGRYYEVLQLRFITPFNVRLSENTLSNDSFVNNQNDFNKGRENFMIDFIEYQKGLEDLVATDCKTEPENFYNKLVKVRERRKVVESDTVVLKELIMTQLNLVKGLREQL